MIEHVHSGRDSGRTADREDQVLHQPQRPFCDRRAARRHRPDGPQDHRGHLRRSGATRRRGIPGKDPTKVDRWAAYYARYIAKNMVAAGLARRALVEVAYAIGRAHPVSLRVDTYGTGTLGDGDLTRLVAAHFDARPQAIIAQLDLRARSTRRPPPTDTSDAPNFPGNRPTGPRRCGRRRRQRSRPELRSAGPTAGGFPAARVAGRRARRRCRRVCAAGRRR